MSQSRDLTQTFEALRAEAETPWLNQVFLPPREFGLLTGPNSILVIGGEGSGKTALELQLKAYAKQKGNQHLLVASWHPQIRSEADSSDKVAEAFFAQTMASLSLAFLEEVAQKPEIYSSAVSWAQDFMHWFVDFYFQGDREFLLSRLREQATPEGLETVKFLLSKVPRFLFRQPTPFATIMSHLTESVKNMGFEAIWIFVEGLDILFRILPGRVGQFLYDFLSTLEFFEDPSFVFKMFVPENLGNLLKAARGVVTRRFKTFDIKWQQDELTNLVEKRIAFTLNCEKFSLGDLCMDDSWLEWLKKYAGQSPRDWLDLTRPILAKYVKEMKGLSTTEWLDIYRQSPPQLHMDTQMGHVIIGNGKVDVSGIGYKLLSYLYQNRDRSCSKSELYYHVYKGLDQEPQKLDDPGWEDVVIWEGLLDTAIYRLRQAIEWDTRKGAIPLYIISERGRGYIHLENVM